MKGEKCIGLSNSKGYGEVWGAFWKVWCQVTCPLTAGVCQNLTQPPSASLIEKTFLRLRRQPFFTELRHARCGQINTHILAPKKCIWGYVFLLSEYRGPSERWCYLTQILLKALLFRYVFGNGKVSPWTEFRQNPLRPCWKEIMILYSLSLLTT